MTASPRKDLRRAKTIVVKIGSSVLTADGWHLNDGVFDRLAGELAELGKLGRRFVLVSSGAVAAGRELLGWKRSALSLPEKQAAAAVGQGHLMHRYQKAFARHDRLIGQVLLTHDDLADRVRFLNARHTLSTLLEHRVVPILNENDSVLVDEIKFGDNDTLAALVTNLTQADLLILLTDIDGFYDRNPRQHPKAKRLSEVKAVSSRVMSAAGSGGALGTGGMQTKVMAAKRAASFGIPTVVASGEKTGVLRRILEGASEGTLFCPARDRLSSRKHWIAHTLKPRGTIQVDAGARDALVKRGKSLLPMGITAVWGHFEAGDAVEIVDPQRKSIAQGISSYALEDVEKIRGKKTAEIEKILGAKLYDEVVHRDDLVLLKSGDR